LTGRSRFGYGSGVARTKGFDPDTVLHSALELFWERGYEATSMADLVAHLGIARASIYATFGSKHALYLRALDLYAELVDPALLHALSQPGPALPAVRRLVAQHLHEVTGDQGQRGCFVVNTAVELAPHDPVAAHRVEASWDHLETALTSALVRAVAQGELPDSRDPRGIARLLVVLLQGLRVIGKSGHGSARARDAVAQALTMLG
jgi:TetR/AcrR family transcriptional regulator, transcriptional repressor for nem operon